MTLESLAIKRSNTRKSNPAESTGAAWQGGRFFAPMRLACLVRGIGNFAADFLFLAMRPAFLFLFFLSSLLSNGLPAQIDAPAQLDMAVQKRPPRHPAKGSWYCNPDSIGKVWYYDGDQWNRLLAGDGRPPFLHQGLVWIPIKENHTLATTSGKIIISDASMVANNGKVFVGVATGDHFFGINLGGDTLSYYQFTYQTRHASLHDPGWTRARIGNQIFDVLPQFIPGMQDYRTKQYRNWGMIGSDGNWVVPPIFDGPFQFINGGIAEVSYYGQKRWINMRGEFVE
jgi:hypothetical protein